MATNSKIIPDVKYDTGILTMKRLDSKDLPSIAMREVVLNVLSTIVDRYEGTVITETIWGEKPNIRLITNAVDNFDTRMALARFFMSRKIMKPLINIIEPRTIRKGEVMITKADLYGAIYNAADKDKTVADVAMELVNSYLLRVGVVSETGDYTHRFEYHFEPVTVRRIGNDVSSFEIVRVMEQAKVVDIADRKYSREAFAEAIATELYELGKAFLDVNSLSTIIDDLVKGVRANLDPAADGLTGMVDPEWRNHDVVSTLSTNWVFIEEALSMPTNSDLTLANQLWKLDKFAPSILAAIKSSQRYAIVGKVEASRHIGTKKVRDLRGRPITSVFWRSARPDPVGMSVYAYEDDALNGAYTLTHTKERLGEVVAAAYNGASDLGTDFVARALVSTLTDAVEAGMENLPLMYQIDLGGYAFVENKTLVALLADRVSVFFDENNMVVRDESIAHVDPETGEEAHSIKMWYTVPTRERDLTWSMSGRFDQSSYLTSSVGEALLAMDELVPSGTIEAKPQLYSANAFNSKIVNFDERSLRRADTRYPFSVEVNRVKIHGSFKPVDIGSMKSNPFTSLVVPMYNKDVFQAVANTFEAMLYIARQLKKAALDPDNNPEYRGGAGLPAFLERNIGRSILSYAQNLAPSFREEIQRGMLNRALIGMPMEASIAMRARLAQRAFGAYADVVALSFFVEMQGMNDNVDAQADEKKDDTFWRRIVRDDVLAQTYFETETDRKPLN